MEFVAIIVIAAVVFGICFGVDKGFTAVFRSKPQHISGLSVRLSKKYGSIGLIMFVLGLSAIFVGLSNDWVLIAGGAIVMLIGVALVVYYMTFGIFYDENSFILTTFGKGSRTYFYNNISTQQLYITGGNVVIELHMTDGSAFQLQSSMVGVYPFLDTAFAGWLKQTGRRQEDCDFYDPENSCWFPGAEG